jgi:hypothetical protein
MTVMVVVGIRKGSNGATEEVLEPLILLPGEPTRDFDGEVLPVCETDSHPLVYTKKNRVT